MLNDTLELGAYQSPTLHQWSAEELEAYQVSVIRESFRHRYEDCASYRRYCNRRDVLPDDIVAAADLTCVLQLPAQVFKGHLIFTGDERAIINVCTCSGARGQVSRISRDEVTLDRLLCSVVAGMKHMYDLDLNSAVVLNLGPTASRRATCGSAISRRSPISSLRPSTSSGAAPCCVTSCSPRWPSASEPHEAASGPTQGASPHVVRAALILPVVDIEATLHAVTGQDVFADYRSGKLAAPVGDRELGIVTSLVCRLRPTWRSASCPPLVIASKHDEWVRFDDVAESVASAPGSHKLIVVENTNHPQSQRREGAHPDPRGRSRGGHLPRARPLVPQLRPAHEVPVSASAARSPRRRPPQTPRGLR